MLEDAKLVNFMRILIDQPTEVLDLTTASWPFNAWDWMLLDAICSFDDEQQTARTKSLDFYGAK